MVECPRSCLEPVSGWDAVSLFFRILVLGFWQFSRLAFARIWRRRRTKRSTNRDPPAQLIDSSIGTHYYIKIMGVKYHYVEAGIKSGKLVVMLGAAPGGGAGAAAAWASLTTRMTAAGYRTVAVDVRGTGGSEPGPRRHLAPPRAVTEMRALLCALGASNSNPVVLVGHGIGGMLTWYLVHEYGNLVSRFAVVGAPHPNLYWQYPPARFCDDLLYFIQWPWLPEHWLASEDHAPSTTNSVRWAGWRACDWLGALHYARGAAWWRVRAGAKTTCPALLVGAGDAGDAGGLVASGAWCARPTLRLVPNLCCALPAASPGVDELLFDFIQEGAQPEVVEVNSSRGGIVGRVLGAVAGRGRELGAVVTRARLALPLSPPSS